MACSGYLLVGFSLYISEKTLDVIPILQLNMKQSVWNMLVYKHLVYSFLSVRALHGKILS